MTLREIYEAAKATNKHDIRKFMRDMKKAGLPMRAYKGRFFWSGPAVVVDDIADAMSQTRIACQSDNMGLQMIVYPQQSL